MIPSPPPWDDDDALRPWLGQYFIQENIAAHAAGELAGGADRWYEGLCDEALDSAPQLAAEEKAALLAALARDSGPGRWAGIARLLRDDPSPGLVGIVADLMEANAMHGPARADLESWADRMHIRANYFRTLAILDDAFPDKTPKQRRQKARELVAFEYDISADHIKPIAKQQPERRPDRLHIRNIYLRIVLAATTEK